MTDKRLELTRRKILASVGAAGVAGAAAGMGTSALFSDEESFTNNSITAGTLDLKVGWEEHYFDGVNRLDFSGNSDISASDVEYVEGSPAGGRTTLPLAATSPQGGAAVSVPDQATALDLLDVTEVDDWPDGFDAQDKTDADDPCAYLADGSDTSPVIIDLDDVKPGDFGEITFSLALCDNPGYLWAQGCLQSAAENGVNEPEADSSNEDQQQGSGDPSLKQGESGDKTVELLDATQAAVWYDNGDNLQSGGGTTGGDKVDIVLLVDYSGSVSGVQPDIIAGAKDLVDLLGQTDAAASVAFASRTETEVTLTELDSQSARQTVKNEIGSESGNVGSGTDIIQALGAAETELSKNGRPGAEPYVILVSDGQAFDYTDTADELKDDNDSAVSANDDFGINIGAIGYGSVNTDFLTDAAGRDPNTPDDDQGLFINTEATDDTIQEAFSQLGGTIATGEEIIIQDSLRNVLNAMCEDLANDDYGLPLDGDRSTQFDEVSAPADSPDREEFSAGTRHDFGFAWWVPRDVGNQIQSDSATFSLGFYAVQSRNNDGSGSASTSGT
jgi:predicted ribosomally synthesized peptide with SipW-like signal peptide